jgi:hypothetical protein
MAGDAHAIPELDRKGYREFGLVTGAIVVGLFGIAIPFIFGLNYPRWPAAWPLSWPWLILYVLGGLALVAPMALKPVYKVWMKFGLFMGAYIMTPLIMFVVFFTLFMPMGLIMRLFGKDLLSKKLDDSADTYRVPSATPPTKNLEKPF